MKNFKYICACHPDEGIKVNDFSLFADIINETENTVTYRRYMKFGQLDCGTLTVTKEEFFYFYEPMTDKIVKLCLKKLNKRQEELK